MQDFSPKSHCNQMSGHKTGENTTATQLQIIYKGKGVLKYSISANDFYWYFFSIIM